MYQGGLFKPWQQYAAIAAIAVLALLIRLHYVHTAVVDHPLRGDAVQYFSYALNLAHNHVFSNVRPGSGAPVPDSFRDPGYPTFLAGLIALRGEGQDFYLTVLDIQAVLSAFTVALYALLALRWLGSPSAIAVALGLTFWPHSITLAGYVLSETLVGFLLVSALWLLQHGVERRSRTIMFASGAVFAAASLTNAVILPVAPLFAGVMAWRDKTRRTLWVFMLVAATLPSMGWVFRNVQLPASQTSSDRIAMNLVQGSWPEYHTAWSAAISGDPAAKATMGMIDAEITRFQGSRVAGLTSILERLARAPTHYLGWYASKPVELWGWSIGIGMGDIYVYPTFASPLSSPGILRSITDLLYLLNPFLMLLMLAGVVATLAATKRRDPALVLAILLATYSTFVFTALQADARYAAPYRGIEWIAICIAIGAIPDALRHARRSSEPAQSA